MSIRVLVVEDEAIIALHISDQLTQAGFQVVGPAPSITRALKLVVEVGCDVGVLDVNLRNETSESVAHELRSRHIPFLFLSAVSRDDLPSGFVDTLLVPKPSTAAKLVAAIESSISASSG